MAAASYGFRRCSPSLDSDDFDLDDQFQDLLHEHFESGKDLNDGIDVEPLFFYGEGELESIKQAKEEKTQKDEREAEEKKIEVAEKERREEETKRSWKKHESVLDSIREFDPKKKTIVWTRYFMDHFGAFDLDEESPVPPMRHTGKTYQEGCSMRWSANVFSIKIVSSDVGFPINVYGTVIARDSLDHKCIYLFRCHRRDSQLIKSEDESLVLTGPFRGFYLEDFIFLEVDLKIRHDQGTDQQLSKGLFEIDGRVVTRQEVEVKSVSHASWFSTVELHYAAVPKAVEAAVEFQALQGDFYGEITAHTASILNRIMLYDSGAVGKVTCDDNGAIQLLRRVVAACLNEMLIFTIVVRAENNAAGAASTRVIEFPPSVHGADEDIVYCGAVRLRVKVTWSVINRYH